MVDIIIDKSGGSVDFIGTANASGTLPGTLANKGTLTVPEGKRLEVTTYQDTPTASLGGGGTLATEHIIRND